MHVIDNVHVKGSVLITRYSQPALVGRCVVRAFFTSKFRHTRFWQTKPLPCARQTSETNYFVSCISTSRSQNRQLNTEADFSSVKRSVPRNIEFTVYRSSALRVTNINFHLLSTIDVSRRWKPCQSSSVDIMRDIWLFVLRELQIEKNF